MLFLSFTACLLLSLERSEAAITWAGAIFGNNGINGSVIAVNGQVVVYVDISGLAADNYSAIGGPSCFANGFSYHIHEKWEHNNTNDRLTSECGADYTGGHWDPWLACGGATGNTLCAVKGGCVNGSSVLGPQGYDCSSDTFEDNPYACEVGDWSGKYGKATVTDDIVYGSGYSPYEVTGADIVNLSVVFHCSSDASRVFCAPFQNFTSDDPGRPTQGKII